MEVEAPPRAQYIRTILFELSRIANVSLFLGDLGVQLGALTPVFYAFRDREYVLNLIEGATGGRFHPNFDRIGGLKDDLPKGWIDETKAVMKKMRRFCDEMEDAADRQRDLPGPHPGHRRDPRRGGAQLRAVGRQPAGLGRRLGPAAGPAAADGVGQVRLEGLDPPGRRRLRPGVGAPPGDARGHQDRRPARRLHAERSDHGQGAPHHQGARGRGLGLDREPARRDGLLRRSRGATSVRSG